MNNKINNSLICFLQTYIESSEYYYKKNYDSMNINDLHTICAIYKHEGINAKKISEALNLTTGAVTKVTKRLEKASYIESFKSEENKKEKYYRVTDEGRRIGELHDKLHFEKFARLSNKLSNFSDKENEVILNFLEQVTKFYNEEMNDND